MTIKLTLEASHPGPTPGGKITTTDTYGGPLHSIEEAERVGRKAARPGDTVRIFEDGVLIRSWVVPSVGQTESRE